LCHSDATWALRTAVKITGTTSSSLSYYVFSNQYVQFSFFNISIIIVSVNVQLWIEIFGSINVI